MPRRLAGWGSVGVVLVGALGSAGCDTDEQAPDPPPGVAFATFNTGLAVGYVPHATARVPAVAEAMASMTADVVCLQEVWTAQDGAGAWTTDNIEAVIAGASATFPHVFWRRTAERGPPTGCLDGVEVPMQRCVEMHCADVDVAELAGCALGNCGDEFDALPSMCSQCIAANVGSSLRDILTACVDAEGSSLAYDGHNGLLLLSRHPLAETEYRAWTSMVTARGALRARLAVPEGPTYDVYCTHLAANLSASLPYPADQSPYGSYAEENAGQLQALMAWVDETARHPAVVMGDTNFARGDEAARLRAVLPESFALAEAGGYRFPYVEAGLPCTFCYGDNGLVDSPETDGKRIDHVMLREADGLVVESARRILDTPVPLATADGEQVLPLSDHYGVEVVLAR